MAIYTKPESIVRRKGSTGGATFTRTANGFIIRKRYVPKQPRSIIQKSNRIKFTSASQHFRSLNNTQRTSFAVSANQFPRYDSLGNLYYLNGQQQNIMLNQNLVLVGLSKRNTGVAPFAFPPFFIAGGAANISPPMFGIAVSPDPLPMAVGCLVYATPVGYYDFNSIPVNHLRLLATLPPGTTGFVNLLNNYVAIFGQPTLVAGLQIVVAIKLMHVVRGLKTDYSFIILSFT